MLQIIILFSLNFVTASNLQTLSNLVIYYFTPTLLMVADSISPMLFWMILVLPDETSKFNIIFNLLGYIITLFSSLIYNEIIIFNFCDLNKNTKKFVNKRLNLEIEEMQRTDSFLDSDRDNDS